ncbi:uncharacterized protein LOC111469304 [Cucurbita maxima]|uniref:Uncharacterized protein LOC111469304 n=1 Tax=Cucurbita maxima TaxID=3661 RepID=A0A6J1I080_CUCMA|nr:uncharacterized protein LOC111469304 [Cucurbita maxima]
MNSTWKKLKLALGFNMCLYTPPNPPDSLPSMPSMPSRFSDAAAPSNLLSQASFSSDCHPPTTPTSSSSGLRLSKSSTRSSKSTCAICLTAMKPGKGHAIFTAECSHSFHFHCITSNVKHGNQICPVCRAKWKEIPLQSPASDLPNGMMRINQIDWSRDDSWMTVLRRVRPAPIDAPRLIASQSHGPEPDLFDDDEVLDHQPVIPDEGTPFVDAVDSSIGIIEVKTYPEVSAVARSAVHDNFTVLVHIKASLTSQSQCCRETQIPFPLSRSSRAPVDLVTVLDISGSMAGTKLALLKRAMGFVIQNLGPSDRLSVISFSSTARRVFSLRRMTESGQQQALQAINSLVSNGGTNIVDGLKKGTKVLLDRKWKNPVCSIMLLSDGQDTYTFGMGSSRSETDYLSLLPVAIRRNNNTALQIPVHSFGFGTDHDATAMHAISEISGGTFSFVEAEATIQDAFAQCIGGLLSVVVQELQVRIECVHPSLQLGSLKAGNYQPNIDADSRIGTINVGDLYAEEERDFLVTINVPYGDSIDEMSLLKVKCAYRKPIANETVTLEDIEEVKIKRPNAIGEQSVSIEVDRQRNRVHALESMARARVVAERGDLASAVSILESCYRAVSETISGQAGDHLCTALCAELKEMKERMENRRIYEASGRAYVLSGLSSHSWQRATARGDSTHNTSLVQAYQTPSMVDMLTRSQTMILGNPTPRPQRTLRPTMTFPARTRQR